MNSKQEKASKVGNGEQVKAETAKAEAQVSGAEKEKEQAAPEAPPVNEKEQAEREALLQAAQAQNNKAASKIASDWARQDRTQKAWMVNMGAACHALFVAECATDKPYKVAMSDLKVRLAATTGEDKSADVTRCIRLYFASLVFGAEQFAKLGIRAQKEVGTLLEGETDEKSKCIVYVLPSKVADLAKKVFAVAVGEVKEGTPEKAERGKDGCLSGEVVAQMVAKVKAGLNPFAPKEASKESEQPPAGGLDEKKGNGKEGTVENATGERPVTTAPRLDVKPAIAGGELVKLLAEHDDTQVVLHSAAKSKEFTAEMVCAAVSGMADVGRIDDLRKIINHAGRELRIALLIEKKKCSRAEAIREVDEKANAA